MMISTKGRYALRVMIDMAEHQTEGYLPPLTREIEGKICCAFCDKELS